MTNRERELLKALCAPERNFLEVLFPLGLFGELKVESYYKLGFWLKFGG